MAEHTWPDGSPRTGVHYFRAGEVVVLVEPPRNGAMEDAERSKGVQDFLIRAFDQVNHTVNPESFKEERDRQSLSLPIREEMGALVLQTVTLEGAPDPKTHDTEKIFPSLARVVRACRDINRAWGRERRVTADEYRIVAATPNWLAVSLHM